MKTSQFKSKFERYYSDSGKCWYVTDRDEGLTFELEKAGEDKYGLSVIIEENNTDYMRVEWSAPEPPCGFLLYDEISMKEFNKLAREYLRKKFGYGGDYIFKEWLNKEIYMPIYKQEHKTNFIIESMPNPGAPEKDWKEFDKCMKEGLKRYEHITI